MDKLLNFAVILVACATLRSVHSANIVFYFGVSSYSHRVPAWPLAGALADQGHNVTFISPFPAKNPNPKIHDYIPTKLKEWVETWGELEDVFQDRKRGETIRGWTMLPEFGKMACDVMYSDEDFIAWIKESKVDLVFVDSLYNECSYGMAYFWNAKMITFDTTSPMPWHIDAFGLPDETNWIPDMITYYPVDMNFKQRMINALLPVAWTLHRKWSYFPYLEQLTREKLNIENLPPFEEIERNTSLVFTNTYFAEEFARALTPNVIPIGGIAWVEKRKPLPKEMEGFLEKGNGFIYVSFGTYADFNRMDPPVQQAMIGALRNFPDVQFVWKVDNATLAQEFPTGNVYVSKWMPQQDILAHTKVKAFVTHSGLLGIQEAVQNAIPAISFPIFAEQDYNAERVHRKEYGIRLEIITLTQAQFEDAINRVLNDPKYRNNMKRISNLFKERPQKPLEVAKWYTNFVLEHTPEELAVLRPLSVGQSWWKKRQLDVWLAILLSLLTFIVSTVFFIYMLVSACFFSSKTQSPASKKQKKH